MRPIVRFTNDRRSGSAVLLCVLVVLVGLSVQVSAQSASTQKGGLYGDWDVSVKLPDNGKGTAQTSILSFSSERNGDHTGQWISVWDQSELEEIKYEDGKHLIPAGGQLNPTWVEWLMGFPLEWTACEPSEMPSSPK